MRSLELRLCVCFCQSLWMDGGLTKAAVCDLMEVKQYKIKNMPEAQGVLIYCLRCKQKVMALERRDSQFANGTPTIKGKCPQCGSRVFQIKKGERKRTAA